MSDESRQRDVPGDIMGRVRFALLLILLAGAGLRAFRLGADSIWYDEAVSLFLAARDLPALIAHTAGDIHPPLYYILLHGWIRLSGSSEYAAGFFSLFFGVMLISLTYVLACRLAGTTSGILSALLVAFSPMHIWYSQEVRMYTLGACLGLVAAWGLWRALREPGGGNNGWIIYALAAAAGLYSLYYFAFLLLAINLWALFEILRGKDGQQLRWWSAAQAGVLLLYGPWLPILIRQATQPPVPPWRDYVPLHNVILESWTALSFGQSVDPTQIWPLLLLTGGLVCLGAYLMARKQPTAALFTVSYVFLPLLLIGAFSLFIPLYHVRYLFTYSPMFYLLLAVGLVGLWNWRRLVAAASLGLILAGSGLSFWQYHQDPLYVVDDHRSAVRFLEEHIRPGDAVLVNAGYVYPTILYYFEQPIAWRGRLSQYGTAFRREDDPTGLVLVQTGTIDGDPDLGWGRTESDFYALRRSDLDRAMRDLFDDYERIWIYRCYDTVTDPEGYLRAWLERHGLMFEETPAFAGLSNIRVQGYLTSSELPTDISDQANPLNVTFNGRFRLEGVEELPEAVDAGSSLDLALWWRSVESPLPMLGISVRLSDQTGEVWAQHDSQPLGSRLDSRHWPTGGLVRHPIRLDIPRGLLPGTYDLWVGVYETGEGLPWMTEAGESLFRVAQVTSSGDTGDLGDAAPPPHRSEVVFEQTVELRRFEIDRTSVLAGHSLHIALEWRAMRPPEEDLIVFIQALDVAGRLVAAEEGPATAGRFPMSRWTTNQLVREVRELHIPADTPAGEYRVILGLYRSESRERLTIPTLWPLPARDHFVLGRVQVEARAAQRSPPFSPAQPVDKRLGPGIVLVGYDLQQWAVSTRDTLQLKLLWQAVGPIQADYAVFCHLIDASGQVWGQADGVPSGGTMPTRAWMMSEYVEDRHTISIRSDAPAGEYRLIVGLYDPRSGERPGEPIELMQLSLSP